MTQEDKQLLLKDISARLPYGVKINVPHYYEDEDGIITLDAFWLHDIQNGRKEIKPYLRPMSSMTEEEKEEVRQRFCYEWEESIMELYYSIEIRDVDCFIDWLNEHHFDYRGLIEKGLAIEAPKDMYKND